MILPVIVARSLRGAALFGLRDESLGFEIREEKAKDERGKIKLRPPALYEKERH